MVRHSPLSLPTGLIEQIQRFIDDHPEAGFTSVPEFLKYIARRYMEEASRAPPVRRRSKDPATGSP